MTKPAWPFPADPKLTTPQPAQNEATVDMEPVDEPELPPDFGLCHCGNEPTVQEEIAGHCDACGKELP